MILISVFQIVNGDVPNSGVGRMALELFNYIKDKKNVQICFGNKGTLEEKNVFDLGKVYYFIYRSVSFLSRFIPYYLVRYTNEFFFDIFFSFRINSNISTLITTNPWIPISAKKAKKLGVKIIFIAGNPNDNRIVELITKEKQKLGIKTQDVFDFKPRLRNYNSTLELVDKIVCINDYIASTFEDGSKTIIKAPTIFSANYSRFNINKEISNDFTFFYCAHTTILKGLHILLDAFNSFSQDVPNVRLFIGGNIKGGLDNRIKSLLKNDKIYLLGNLTSEQMAMHMKCTDVFIVPSICDAGPVTVIEAMFSRTPVICSNGVGHQFLIEDEINGFLYDKFDTHKLVSILSKCYRYRNKLSKLGESARERIEKELEKGDAYLDIIYTSV